MRKHKSHDSSRFVAAPFLSWRMSENCDGRLRRMALVNYAGRGRVMRMTRQKDAIARLPAFSAVLRVPVDGQGL